MKYKHYLLIALSALTLFSEDMFAGPDLPFAESPLGEYGLSKGLPPRAREIKKLPEETEFSVESGYAGCVKDQGSLGSCTIFTATACLGRLHQKSFSEGELSILVTSVIKQCHFGLPLIRVLTVVQKFGALLESALSYEKYVAYTAGINPENVKAEDRKVCETKSDPRKIYNTTMESVGSSLRLHGDFRDISSYRFTELYPLHHTSLEATARASGFSKVLTGGGKIEKKSIGVPGAVNINDIKKSLAAGYPVAVSGMYFESCWSTEKVKEKNYTVCSNPLPEETKEEIKGHAFMLTGYDDAQESFILQNSWGAGWGRNGYAWLSYDYLRKYAIEAVAVSND